MMGFYLDGAKKIVSDEAIKKAFTNTNFGHRSKHMIVADALLSLNAGYSPSHTATVICRELGLLGKYDRPNKNVRIYMCYVLNDFIHGYGG